MAGLTDGFSVLLIAERAEAATQAIGLAGGHVAASSDWPGAAAALAAAGGGTVLVLDTRGADAAVVADALDRMAPAAGTRDGGIVAVFDPPQIDLVAGALFDTGAQLLCAPTLAEWVVALSLAGRPRRGGTLVREREGERADALRQIAQLVATLIAQEDEAPAPLQVADRRRGFGDRPGEGAPVDPATLRGVLRARRMRDQHVGAGLFEDPAWDMLLDLFAALLENRRVSVSSLCIAAAVAPTTALRWIGKLTEEGLVAREPDGQDRRRVHVALTPEGRTRMEDYAAAVTRAGLTLV